jgi:hypothetical protein
MRFEIRLAPVRRSREMAAMPAPFGKIALFIGMIVSAHAVPVGPVQRTLTDQFERTTEVSVVGVTADSIKVVRAADQARFSIALDKLSKGDQEFARKLLAENQRAEPLADTPWLQAIRRDFQIYDAAKNQFLSLPADLYAQEPILVVGFTGIHDPSRVFDSRTGRILPSGEHVLSPPNDQAPILWILDGGKIADFHTAAQKLPEGHAMISYTVRENIEKRALPFRGEAVSKWLKQNPPKPDQTSRRVTLSDEERDALSAKVAKVTPVYWFEPLAGIFQGLETPLPMPLFGAFYRDGTPVKYQDAHVRGSRQQVMSMLRALKVKRETSAGQP